MGCALLLRGPPDYSTDTASELTRRCATGNCDWRTCPRSLRGVLREVRTHDLPDSRHRTHHWATTPYKTWFDGQKLCERFRKSDTSV